MVCPDDQNTDLNANAVDSEIPTRTAALRAIGGSATNDAGQTSTAFAGDVTLLGRGHGAAEADNSDAVPWSNESDASAW